MLAGADGRSSLLDWLPFRCCPSTGRSLLSDRVAQAAVGAVESSNGCETHSTTLLRYICFPSGVFLT